MNDNLTRLEKLLSVVDSALTKDDFIKAFENVVQFLLQMKQQHSDTIGRMETTYKNMFDKLQSDHTSSLDELKGKVDSLFVGGTLDQMKAEHNQRMQAVDQKLATVKDGLPGQRGEKGNPGVKGDMGSPDTGKMIKAKLEELQGDARLDVSAIKGLEEMVSAASPKTIFGPGKTRVFKIDLSSQLNGVKKTFFLGTHFGILQVDSSSAPFGAFRETTDYNESGKNIVFTSNVDATISLASGQSLVVKVLR